MKFKFNFSIGIFIILILFVFCISCAHREDVKVNCDSTEVILSTSEHDLAFGIQYIYKDTDLIILLKRGHEELDDSILFQKKILEPSLLSSIRKISIDSLNPLYENPCIVGGTEIYLIVKKGAKQKLIKLSNYHHPVFGELIELINQNVPSEFKINYDKQELIEKYKDCDLVK